MTDKMMVAWWADMMESTKAAHSVVLMVVMKESMKVHVWVEAMAYLKD